MTEPPSAVQPELADEDIHSAIEKRLIGSLAAPARNCTRPGAATTGRDRLRPVPQDNLKQHLSDAPI
jgi:hypothetical protein